MLRNASISTQSIDPREIDKWETAFEKHPIPTIRTLEVQLRTTINDGREKVRSLVGSSYRELLGTADRVVDMDSELQRFENMITTISLKCNSGLLDRVSRNYNSISNQSTDEQLNDRRSKSEAGLLQACLVACQRLIKTNGDLSIAARLISLARLLQNSLSKSGRYQTLIKGQRLQYSSVRSRLLGAIRRKIEDISLSRPQMIEILLAYSLATTSSLADVSRYLLRIRQEAIAELTVSSDRSKLVQAFDLTVTTADHVKALFPTKMADALDRLMSGRLLDNEHIRKLLDFDLGLYEMWISPEIRSFVPFLRNRDVDQAALNMNLVGWTDDNNKSVLLGLSNLMLSLKNPSKIIELRDDFLRHVFASRARSKGQDIRAVVGEVRRLSMNRMGKVIDKRTESLISIVQNVVNHKVHIDQRVDSIWDQIITQGDLRDGATIFRHQLSAKTQGKDQSLQGLDESLARWSRRMNEVRTCIKKMQQSRWDDDLDINMDVETGTLSYQEDLAKEDPSNLSEKVDNGISTITEKSLQILEDTAETCISEDNVEKAAYLLRVIRAFAGYCTSEQYKTRQSQINKRLHSIISARTVLKAREKHGNLFTYSSLTETLWQGIPPLPVQPLPSTFRLLKDVNKIMCEMGSDIWIPEAVNEVKRKLVEVIKLVVSDVISTTVTNDMSPQAALQNEEHEIEPTTEKVETEGISQDTVVDTNSVVEKKAVISTEISTPNDTNRYFQILFDILYLQEILSTKVTSANDHDQHTLSAEMEILRKKCPDLNDDEIMERMRKSAGIYYRRTYLLFALLVSRH